MAVLGTAVAVPVVVPRLPGRAGRHRLRAGELCPERRRVAAAGAGPGHRADAAPGAAQRRAAGLHAVDRSPSGFRWCSAPPRATTSSPATSTTPGPARSRPDPPVVSAGATVMLGSRACCCCCAPAAGGPGPLRVDRRPGRGTTEGLGLGAWRGGCSARCSGCISRRRRSPRSLALALSSVVSELTPLIAPWHLFTLGNWQTIGQGQYIQSIRNTAEIALVGALVTTAVVALATAVAHRSGFRLRRSPAVPAAVPPGHPRDHHRDRVLLDILAGQPARWRACGTASGGSCSRSASAH